MSKVYVLGSSHCSILILFPQMYVASLTLERVLESKTGIIVEPVNYKTTKEFAQFVPKYVMQTMTYLMPSTVLSFVIVDQKIKNFARP